jgi:Mg2+ and Co2+ transporter CorA
MRCFHVGAELRVELDALPATLPAGGFLWLSCERSEFEAGVAGVQSRLQTWAGAQLVDLHVRDLLNKQLPSSFDYTAAYDLLVFRRLAVGAAPEDPGDEPVTREATRRLLAAVDTSPIGFAAFDRVLLTVHPADCAVRDFFAQRLLQQPSNSGDARGQGRLPASPADLMLRMANHMVDGYLELRRLLTRHFDALQNALLDPKSRFGDWKVLLDARTALHLLEDTSEDQRGAIQEWIDALNEWPLQNEPGARRERELLRVRSRDLLEHIERVLTHVRRLEHSAEVAVQMHFSALGHRTNDIMRTLTVLTAIFLPLNLITGFFGMNFDNLPLIHSATGAWTAIGVMVAIGIGLGIYFRRKRYLGSSPHK